MAAANLIARFESKLEAQNAKIDSKFDAMESKFENIPSEMLATAL